MSDTIYADLKEQGLILSKEVEIGFPPIRSPKPGLLGQLVSYVVPQKNFQNENYQLIITPVLNNCFIVGRCNTLLCYKYEIDRQTDSQKPVISKPNINNLPFKIQKLHICANKYLKDRGEIPFIAESKNLLVLFSVDLKENKIVERNSIVISNILSVSFICEKEIMVLSSVSGVLTVHHLLIQNGKMKEKNKMSADLEIGVNEKIKQVNILGNIDEEQESIICLFYYCEMQDNSNSQVLKIKEYLRDLQGKITPQSVHTVINTQNSVVLTENYEIVAFDNYYCILVKHEILILKKKFDRYLFIDNVMEKIGGNTLKLHPKGIITSHSGNSMEINVIIFNDPKCYSKILDNIEIPAELSQGFLMCWPFKQQKETSLMFVFKKEKRLVFYNLRKTDPYQKMIMVVSSTPKDKISVVQEIAVNLGISKKAFYLSQWAHSKRQISDIYQFLLPCSDITSIKKQLRMTMRRKKIEVSELLKILQKSGKIIKNELKTNLSQNLLKQYIRNDFLMRKIKLKQASKKMDYKEMDKVYDSSLSDMFVEIINNQLYPSEKLLDPLHAMMEAPIKQQANLKHVFQEFRIMILQDYKNFLVKFISCFNENQIVKVIDEYHFLFPTYNFSPKLIIHEPDYMTEVQLNQMILKAEKTQEQWFSDMTSIQFARQMSKQRLEKQLHDYYPNSKIHQAINILIAASVKEKLHKHGLISCNMAQYKQKLKDIQGIKLYLKVCQHANQHNIKSNTDRDLSTQIVQIFKNKNKLQGQAYFMVKLYASMHRFMLKNNFCQKKVMSAQELMQLKSQDLVALFFLQNRQRKEFIFRQFRDLYVDLYKGPQQFNAVIFAFIQSDNCSRIELQIFINEIKNKGQEFQVDNQDLIQLIIDGFCKKLELREESDTQRFLDIMEEIELNKKLVMKISKINQVRGCLQIFDTFNMQKKSYYKILQDKKDNNIFKTLLSTYFNHGFKKDFVLLEDDQVSLDFCRNMMTILLYLQENVYYEVTERELLLCYFEGLVEWKQFQVIKGIIYDEQVLEKLEIPRQGFVDQLIERTLLQIYLDQEIIYDPQTKQHIRCILDIHQGESLLKSMQYAKLQLVQIFQSWGTIIHTRDIRLITVEWSIDSSYRQEFLIDLIDEYITHLNFPVFQQVYRYLEMASGKHNDQVDICNEEFVKFALGYAEKLLEHNIYDQIVRILAFVKTMPGVKIVSYSLISETFLKSLFKINPDEDSIPIARQAIQYFTQYFSNDDQRIQQIFETDLVSAKFEYKSVQRQVNMQVKDAFCFSKKHPVNIEIDVLWDIASAVYEEKGKNIETLYYAYYFLIMLFRNPDYGFTKNHKISYSFDILYDLIFKLETKIDENSDLWGINIYAIYKRFLRGLYLQGLSRIKEFNPQHMNSFDDNAKIDAIKARLKQDKQYNSELLKCVSKVQTYLAAYKSVRKTQKQLRFEKLRQTKEPQNVTQEIIPVEAEVEIDNQAGVTLNLKKYNARKFEISQSNNRSGIFLSEKQILQRIYELETEEKQNNRRANRPKKGANFFLPNLLNSTTKQSTLVTIQKHIQNEEWDKLRNLSKEDVAHVAESLYNSSDRDFHQLASILRELRILDEKKIEVLMFCKIYLNENNFTLTSDELKKMFPFTYLIEPAEENTQEFKQRMFMVMRGAFESIVQNKDNDFIRSMANYIGNILNENAYVCRFYIDMIILTGRKRLEAETIIRITIIMHILREYPADVRSYLTNILEAFKENSDLLDIIKQELLICLQDMKEEDMEKYIKEY